MTYQEKLQDPRWQKRRLGIFERDSFTCQHCGSSDACLHVHHKRYRKGKNPWESEDQDLVTVCEDCHESLKNSWQLLASVLADQTACEISSVANLLSVLITASPSKWLCWLYWSVQIPGTGKTKNKEILEAETKAMETQSDFVRSGKL